MQMPKQFTLKQVLDMAVLKEQEAQALYARLGSRAKNPAVKEAFKGLIAQEKQHEHMLEDYRSGTLKKGALHLEHPCDARIAEHFAGPAPSPAMELKDAFLYAADREKASHDFYLALASMHESGEVRSFLHKLASQELEHKTIVEGLFTEVAFPQTDGG
jgi:rubrerythrin